MTSETVELENILLRALFRAWNELNQTHFRSGLRAPQLVLSDSETQLGSWQRMSRTLSLARKLVRGQPWGVTLEVLKHEMAHQYAHEVLGAIDETAHGPAFREVCTRMGIDLHATGLPTAGEVDPETERVTRRVTRLLALAESPNANEAEAAMAAARKLLLRYNLDVAPSGYAFRQLGSPNARIASSERMVAGLLGAHFFVETIWVQALDPSTGKEGRVLEICGSPANLDMAAWVRDFILETAWRLWRRHRVEARTGGERERERFTAGVVRGFHDKLDEGARQSREEGLVWVGDAGTERFLRQRYPRIRTVRYGGPGSDTFEHGRAAGRDVVLHRPVTAGPGQGPMRRLTDGS